MVATEVRAALAEQQERLEPLAAILEIRPDTARKRLKRDRELAALALATRGRTASVDTSKPAKGGRGKTGHQRWRPRLG